MAATCNFAAGKELGELRIFPCESIQVKHIVLGVRMYTEYGRAPPRTLVFDVDDVNSASDVLGSSIKPEEEEEVETILLLRTTQFLRSGDQMHSQTVSFEKA